MTTQYFEESDPTQLGHVSKIEIKELLASKQSQYQQIDFYKTKAFGNMLVLNGIVQTTEFDECAYHEMIAHVPLCTHPDPERVLIIGGGDGGTLREVLKHKEVFNIDVCEIDKDVIEMSQEFLPSLACGYEDKRVRVYNEDGYEFLKTKTESYDVIIVDSSDPIGFAATLFTNDFYFRMSMALKIDGLAVTQSESLHYYPDIVKRLNKYAKENFSYGMYYYALVPTYPSGTIGFTFCAKTYHPIRDVNMKRSDYITNSCKYYTYGIHRGSFQLPNFLNGVNL